MVKHFIKYYLCPILAAIIIIIILKTLAWPQDKPEIWNPDGVTTSFVIAGWLKHAERIDIHLKGGQTVFVTGSTITKLEEELNACHESQIKKPEVKKNKGKSGTSTP